jgi:hypothetical protein
MPPPASSLLSMLARPRRTFPDGLRPARCRFRVDAGFRASKGGEPSRLLWPASLRNTKPGWSASWDTLQRRRWSFGGASVSVRWHHVHTVERDNPLETAE